MRNDMQTVVTSHSLILSIAKAKWIYIFFGQVFGLQVELMQWLEFNNSDLTWVRKVGRNDWTR